MVICDKIYVDIEYVNIINSKFTNILHDEIRQYL